MLRWNKKMCIEYSMQMRSYLEEMLQSNAQMPALLQKLTMQPRQMKIQKLMGGNEQGESGMNEEMMTDRMGMMGKRMAEEAV